MTKSLHVTLAQLNPIVGDLNYNLDLIQKTWKKAPKDTDLIVFPEMMLCGYPPEDLVFKNDFIDQVFESVLKLLEDSKNHESAILVGTPWGQDKKLCNAALLIEDGEIRNVTIKHHLPNYGVFDEQRLFHPGPLPKVVKFRDHKLGIMICEDMWYTDVAENFKRQNAELLIVINGSPFETFKDCSLEEEPRKTDKKDRRHDFARDCVRAANTCLLYVNQVGGQDELVFDGASFVMDHSFQTLYTSPSFIENIISVKITDPPRSPLLKFRYKPTHGKLLDVKSEASEKTVEPEKLIYMALVTGLRDYISKNNFPGVVLGLSGGIDSALSTVIAVEALGADKVHCVMMPSKFTSQDSIEDATELARNLGTKLDTIPIQTIVDNINSSILNYVKLQGEDKKNIPPVTFENIQSRARGLILMALSNASGNMVLSTGNKSEMAVGYATLYGDMNGGFNVLKDVYKTQVYELARLCNKNQLVIPERILTKAPTAELKENQTDQDSLPPYEELDDILHCLIEHDMGMDAIVRKGHDADTVARVWTMLDRAEYKRRQAPPGIKITARAFGRDRRYPITNHFLNIIAKT